MRYAIQVNSSPYDSEAGYHGYRFIKTALLMGHEVIRVFFYQEGIYHAFRYNTPPDDERNLTALWSQLALEYKLDLVVCISSAQRRGLLHADEAKRQQKQGDDIASGFRISGLGQLVEASLKSERFMVFG